MMFALKLLGWGKVLAGWIRTGAAWLVARWYRAVIAALVVACLWLWFALGDVRAERDKAYADLAAEQVAHADFVQSVADAAKEAERRAVRNVERVRDAYAAQAKEASDENQALAADYDRRVAEFVRRQRAAAYPGRPGATDLPGATAMPAGPVQDPDTALVPVSDLNRCAVGFAQLTALISYVQGIAAVPTVPVESPDASNP